MDSVNEYIVTIEISIEDKNIVEAIKQAQLIIKNLNHNAFLRNMVEIKKDN
jgi:hypothetical protein